MTLNSFGLSTLAALSLLAGLGDISPAMALNTGAAAGSAGGIGLAAPLEEQLPSNEAASLVQTASAAASPLEGTWDCDGSTVQLSAETYRFGGQKPLRITGVTDIAENSYGLTFHDGTRVAFFFVTETSMEWHSPASGDTFLCSRLVAAEPAAPSPPAPVAGTGTQDAAASRYPFEGEWSCYHSPVATGAQRHHAGHLSLTDQGAIMANLDLKGLYSSVNPIGRSGTAYSLTIDVGFPMSVAIYELEASHMLVNSSGVMLECVR